MKRSIGAVLAGLVFVIVVTTLVDVALHAAGVYPKAGESMGNALALLATSYRVVIGILGAWLTARLAPRNPMKHALALGYAGMALGLLGLAVTWGKGLAPMWYPIGLIVLALPQSWLGGWLSGQRRVRYPAG